MWVYVRKCELVNKCVCERAETMQVCVSVTDSEC